MVKHPITGGMRYKDAIKSATRHAKEMSSDTVASMAGQVRAHEGEKAAREFAREAVAKGNEQRDKNRRYI